MQRLPSTLALAVWSGFLLTSIALAPIAGAFNPFAPPVPRMDMAETVWEAVLLAGLGGCAVTLAGAVFFLHRALARRRGERLGLCGFAGIGIIGGLCVATGRGPLAEDAAGGAFWALLGLSAAAIVFDRLVAVEDRGDDDETFEASIAVIARGMARQTQLYTKPDGSKASAAPGSSVRF